MKLACLFWFYKSPELCENRLSILRRYNPEISIYGLYGGDLLEASVFKNRLAPFLDDFYAFPEARSSHWKWYHGDQMIAHWYAHRGQALDWDTIFVAQWDMLVFDSLQNQFSMLRQDELLLSGLRPVSEVDPWWYYVRPDSEERLEYEQFITFVREVHDYKDEPLCSEFIVACLPRSFLSRYVDIPRPDLGFLEYKIPVYAQIFGTPLCRHHPHQPWWGDHPDAQSEPLLARALNSETQNVPLRVIEAHRLWPWGRKIFHPVFDDYPTGTAERMTRIAEEIYHDELKRRWWQWHKRYFDKHS